MGFLSSLGRIGGGLLGNALLPGLGGIAGGALGGAIGNLFGGGRRGGGGQAAGLPSGMSALQQQLTADATANPYQSATYRQGLGDMNRQLAGAARTDTARAAARGLLGSEFELAQAGARTQQAASIQGNLLNAAVDQRQNAQTSLMSLLERQQEAERMRQERAAQGRTSVFGTLGNVAAAALPALINRRPGGGG